MAVVQCDCCLNLRQMDVHLRSSAGTDVELRLAQARSDRRSCAEALEVSGENVDNIRNLAKSVMATEVPCDAECFDYSK